MADRASITGWEFENFVSRLLQQLPDVTRVEGAASGAAGDPGVDFVVDRDGYTILIQLSTQTPQTSRRLRESVQRLRTAGEWYAQNISGDAPIRLILVFPGVVRKPSTPSLQVEIWDGPTLQRMARSAGLSVPEFVARAPGEERAEEREPADDLLRRLSRIGTGKEDWLRFENFCQDLLGFLFCPPLNQVVSQHSTESGVNRRDFIMPNYALDGFWSFMRTYYHADFVVAEAKNYEKPIGKSEVLQLTNYLSRHGVGLVGLLLTRRGFNYGASWTSREQWLLHDKLIVGLDDSDYQQMLETKRTGGDPADLVRQRIEDFRLKI